MELYILIGAFFFIALIYSSVGFGGGSSYLALMAQPFFSLMPDTIRPTALLCNVVVVTGGTIIFYRQGKLLWKDIWPFIVMSVPLAFVGGLLKLQDDTFFIILGFTLLLVSILLWIQQDEKTVSVRFGSISSQLGGRGGIGFLSGLVSIGGGIFLSPILHLVRWAEAKKISALASVFILVNSVGGLLGQFSRGLPPLDWTFIASVMVAVFAGWSNWFAFWRSKV
ncbi:MAG: sulfite exporter TauE/SafE family protein [Cytophagales bacterium]|nr:sulfite exporter TauE/SafE family protein [Cytophagales bacterium]